MAVEFYGYFSLGVWLIARFPHFLALGLSSWVGAVVMGSVAVMGQMIVWHLITGRELKRG